MILFRITRENGHGCARAGQAQRHSPADSAIATGNHGDVVTQVKKRPTASHRASVRQGYRKPSDETNRRPDSPLRRLPFGDETRRPVLSISIARLIDFMISPDSLDS